MKSISATVLKQKLDKNEKLFIIDVRDEPESAQMKIGIGENLMPLGKLRNSLDQLPKEKDTEIIVFCKISLRGYQAYSFLTAEGWTNVKVLEGGIIAWPFAREK